METHTKLEHIMEEGKHKIIFISLLYFIGVPPDEWNYFKIFWLPPSFILETKSNLRQYSKY